jgi:hypothetical protein
MKGRYPDFDVFDTEDTWDEATTKVVRARINVSHALSFFDEREALAARVLCDLVTDQDAEPRIPVLELIDEKFHKGKLDGFHFEDLPEDRETWRRVLRGLDETAEQRHAMSFLALSREEAQRIVEDFAEGSLSGGAWSSLNVARAWSVCTRAILAAFYSHPWAWNEIGFGGPAYPRGYMRMGGLSTRDPFETTEDSSPDPVREVGS